MHTGTWTTDRRGVPAGGLSLAFAGGALLVLQLPRPVPILTLAALGLVALWPRLPARGLCLALWLGALHASLLAGQTLADRWPAERHGEQLEVGGQVRSLPEWRDGDVRFVFAPDAAARAAGLPRRLRVGWYDAEDRPRAGDCWQFTLRVRAPRGRVSPGAFDHERWLFQAGLGAMADVRAARRCAPDHPAPVHRLRERLRDRIDAGHAGHPARGLMLALLLGDRSGLSDADWTVFRNTGTTHLMAISGMQVGLVAGLVLLLVRRGWAASAWLSERIAAPRVALVAAALSAMGYAALAGFQVPTQRALVMWLVLAAAFICARGTRPARPLAIALALVVLIDPRSLLAAGTWLSFAAVAGILWLMSGRRGRGRRDWRDFAVLQFGLLAVLTPLSLLFFAGATWMDPLVNALAIPLYALLLPALVLAFVLSLLLPPLGEGLLGWVVEALQLFRLALGWASAATQAWVHWPVRPLAAGLALLGAVLMLLPRGLPLWGLSLALCLPALWPVTRAPADGLQLAVLDVGQGLAVTVRTRHHLLLFDAGPAFDGGFDAGASVVLPWLRHEGVRRVDMLVLSHRHADHYGGLAAVREALPVVTERGTGLGPPCIAGERWRWDGVEFEFLHPAQPQRWTVNNVSCVLRIRVGDRAVLITGDIERRAELTLLREHGAALKADVLVAPHHGSATSSIPEFVAAVGPQWVFYGAGWRNRHRHPRAEVVARYAALGARQYATGDAGTLVLDLPATGPARLTVAREAQRALWRLPPEVTRGL